MSPCCLDKMKKTLTLVLLVLTVCQLQAQSGWSRRDRQDFKTAQVALTQGDYAYVYQLLNEIQPKDSSFAPVNLALGIACLEWKNDKDRALNLLSKAAASNHGSSWFWYAKALHRNMQFNEAIAWYLKSSQSESDEIESEEVLRHIQISRRAQQAVASPVDVRVKNLGPEINTEFPEYVPVVTADNRVLYFTSRRDDSTAQLKDPDGQYFEDIYRSERNDQKWSKAINLGQPVNSETHDATVSISADGRSMVIYRTNENLTGGDLYITTFRRGAWTEPEKLPAGINTAFQEASATLSPDKNTLIFSSNRPGGYGGKDLYRVRRLPNGQWSLPRNLGPVINTPYDEDAPHLDVDGKTLYFASNGHSTIGGYDIFRSTLVGRENWTTPENLGYPVNTVDDDIYLTLDAGGRTGYFSSARPGGFGSQDIYSVDFVYRRQVTVVMKGEVVSEDNEPIQAVITVIDESTREIQGIYRTNRQNGKFIAVLHPLTQYKLLVECTGYDSLVDELVFPFPEGEEMNELEMPPFVMRAQ